MDQILVGYEPRDGSIALMSIIIWTRSLVIFSLRPRLHLCPSKSCVAPNVYNIFMGLDVSLSECGDDCPLKNPEHSLVTVPPLILSVAE